MHALQENTIPPVPSFPLARGTLLQWWKGPRAGSTRLLGPPRDRDVAAALPTNYKGTSLDHLVPKGLQGTIATKPLPTPSRPRLETLGHPPCATTDRRGR